MSTFGRINDSDVSTLGDYFVVVTRARQFFVSKVIAQFVESRLDHWSRPRWITFVDLFGSRVRVRRDTILYVAQRTADQRASHRAFDRAFQREIEDEEEDEA